MTVAGPCDGIAPPWVYPAHPLERSAPPSLQTAPPMRQGCAFVSESPVLFKHKSPESRLLSGFQGFCILFDKLIAGCFWSLLVDCVVETVVEISRRESGTTGGHAALCCWPQRTSAPVEWQEQKQPPRRFRRRGCSNLQPLGNLVSPAFPVCSARP